MNIYHLIVLTFTLHLLVACEGDNNIQVNTNRVTTNLLLDQPIKALYISDIHYRPEQLIFDDLSEIAKQTKPDLILLGGDYTGMSPKETDLYRDFIATELSHLTEIAPTFSVLGNHEYYTSPNQWRRTLKRSPINAIDNAVEKLNIRGRNVCIRGLGDAYTDNYKYTPFSSECGGLRLTLTHDPYAIELDSADGFDLSPTNQTMTTMRFPINLTGWRSHYEEALQRRTNHYRHQRARGWRQGRRYLPALGHLFRHVL